jgi:electron transfer flavoprotein alpha subunit
MFSLVRKNSRLFSTLLLAESRGGVIHPANLTALAAAQKLKKPIDVLVLDSETKAVNIQAEGVRDVFAATHQLFANPTAEAYSHAVSAFIKSQNKYTHVVSAASTFSKDYFPRLAAMHGCQPLSEVTEVIDEVTFKRPTYAGSAIATVRSTSPIHFLNTRPTSFDPVSNPTAAAVKQVEGAALLAGLPQNVAKWVSEQVKKSERPDLAQAKIVVAGGRGRLD